MVGLGGEKGNYPYASARAKGKKSKLLTKDNYPKLLMMDLNEISRFMGETQYKTEMTELGGRYSGVDLIELGTSRNLARTYRSVIGFCNGELREMVVAYLRRWDVWNVKTILRGKYYGATQDEIREDLVPAGEMDEDYLNNLLAMDRSADVLEAVKAKKEFEVPDEAVSAFEKTGSLAPIEDHLDLMYYNRLKKSVPPTTAPKRTFLTFIQREIDVQNIRTLLKMKHAGLPVDKVRPYLLDGGSMLKIDELGRLAGIENFDSLLDELSKLPLYEDVKEGIEKYKVSGSLNDIMLGMDKYLAKQAEKFSKQYPLSILPVIDYILRKEFEVNNIRTIARGKAAGLDNEVIKSLLVI